MIRAAYYKKARSFLEKHPRFEWLIPLAFCLILVAQLLLSVQQMSQHADEAIHFYAGYRALKCGDYTFGREHPPLAKMLVAIPLLWSNPAMDCTRFDDGFDEEYQATTWLYAQEAWWHYLCEARVVSSVFSVALCLGVWIVARRFFGRAVAALSCAFLVFEPNILGHGALLLNNVVLAALFLFTVYCFYLWTLRRSLPWLGLTGLFTGMALLTKHSGVLLIPILCLLAVGDAWLGDTRLTPSDEAHGDKEQSLRKAGRSALQNLGAVATVAAIALVIIWCGYGMRYSGDTRLTREQESKLNSADVQVLKAMRAAHILPQPYVDGLIDTRSMLSDGGVAIQMFGKRYATCPWFYLPLCMTIKFTLPFLAMLLLGAAGVLAFGRQRRREFLFLLLPGLLFLASGLRVQRNATGIYHLFPMLPFLLIAAAAGCVYLARRYRWAGGAVAGLLVLHAIASLHSYPNYLSYANELWGGSQNLSKHLPWTDLDQTFWQVSHYMEQHPNTPCWVASDWYVPVEKYNVPCTQMGNRWGYELPVRMKGIVFVSSSWLRIDGQPGGALAPFSAVEPKARLGGSAMLVYEGEFDTPVAAARALDNEAGVLFASGQHAEALPLTKRAAELAPEMMGAHESYCRSLAFNDRPEEALVECDAARKLALQEPWNQGQAQEAVRHMKYIAKRFGVPLPPGVE